MSTGQKFVTFGLYDFISNITPGAAAIVGMIVTFPPLAQASGIPSQLGILSFIILAFVVGRIIHSLAEKLRPRNTFRSTLNSIKQGDSSGSEIVSIEAGERFWKKCKSQFGLSDDFSDNDYLMKLLQSYFETVPTTQVEKFQIMWTFCRNMWVVSWTMCSISSIATVVDFYFMTLSRPSDELALIAGTCFVSALVFGWQEEKFDELFVKYVFTDFHVSTPAPPSEDNE